jgi:hypothetical protein
MPFNTRRSSTLGRPRGLFGSKGWMVFHSNSNRLWSPWALADSLGEFELTAVGRDLIPVLFMVGAWGRKYRGGGKLRQFLDAETGNEIQPIVIESATGAQVGTRAIKTVLPTS